MPPSVFVERIHKLKLRWPPVRLLRLNSDSKEGVRGIRNQTR